jgi:hypothetical protein
VSIQPVLSDEFCAAIGRVVANFGFLEIAVGQAVAGLAHGRPDGPDDIWPPEDLGDEETRVVGEILTSGSSFRRNVEVFACLQRLRNPKHDQKALDELLAELFGVEEERNKVVHSVWSGGDDDKAGRHKITSRSKGHKVTNDEVPIQHLHDLAERIGVACSRLMPYMFGGKPRTVSTETSA